MNTRRTFIRTLILTLAATVYTTGVAAKSCLWKVESETAVLYLQGSVHFLKADNYPLAPAIEDAYKASDALVLEADMEEMTSMETQQKLLAKAMLKDGETLQQQLDAETYELLGEAFGQAGMPVEGMANFKPWFACTTLVMLRLQAMGFNPQLGLDTYFYDKADADEKRVIGLESVDFQIDLFDSLSETDPNAYVRRSLADLELIETDIASLEKAWETGDIESLSKLMARGFKDYPEFYKTFLLDRNEDWLGTLSDLLKTSDTYMVVVGAGHLGGEGGLLELLEEKGYTLEQL